MVWFMVWNNTSVQEMQETWAAIGSLCKTMAHTFCKFIMNLEEIVHYEFEIFINHGFFNKNGSQTSIF